MKVREPDRHGRRGECERLVLDDAALIHHRPGKDDVLADRVWPSADRLDVFGPVGGEGALGDEGAVVGGLHPFDAVDSESVVPLLHPGEEVGVSVFDDDGAGAGADVLILRVLGYPGDEILEGVGVEVGIGVDGDHEWRLDRLEDTVEGVELAGLRLEHSPVVEAQSRRGRLGELGCPVGRVVVRQHHLDMHPGRWSRRVAQASLRSPAPHSTPRPPPSLVATHPPATAPSADQAPVRDTDSRSRSMP